MTDDLERLLHDALDADARRRVGDAAAPPPPRFAAPPSAPLRRRRALRLLTPFAAAAVVIGIVVVSLAAAGVLSGGDHAPAAGSGAVPVRVRVQPMPHSRVGVGLPVVAYFSQRFTDASAWQRATRVTVDGHPVAAAWYFVPVTDKSGEAIAGHLRMRHFWPADATIAVRVPDTRIPAGSGRRGTGYVITGGLHVTFRTGPADVATVLDSSHHLTLVRGNRTVLTCPVSLGKPSEPTMRGTKVIMAKDPDRTLRGAGYVEAHVKDTQRLTDSGEYLLAAPWVMPYLHDGVDSSSGSTDLSPNAAARLYRLLRVGDVVRYPDATGPRMPMSDGYGDWNVPWSKWQSGGLIPTR
jgi:hypothetical protein